MVWLMLGLGLVLLVVGADALVKGAARLATSFGIPALVVGLTVVAFGTSAPELAVSVKAAFSGQAELAIANVVGSNTFNILFILGLAALISPLLISRQLIRQDVPIMVGVSVVAVLMTMNGSIQKWEAGLLVLGLVCYTGFLFVQGKKNGGDGLAGESGISAAPEAPAWRNLLLVVVGLAMLVVGARWLVGSAVTIATGWGINEAVIGLTIVAAGTSLPEVMTSVVATIKGERDIAVGNVVGSNIFNVLCVLGVSGLASPTPLLAGPQLAQIDIPVMVAVAVLCAPLFFVGGTLSRFEGALFLFLYMTYVWYLIAVTLSVPYMGMLNYAVLFVVIPAVVLYVLAALVFEWRQRRVKKAGKLP